MAKNRKQTSKVVASKASSLLRDGKSSAKTKAVAGSALSQTRPSPKKKGPKHNLEVENIPSNGAECELPNGRMIYETQVRNHPAICVL